MNAKVGRKINKLQIGGYLKLGEWWRGQHAAMLAARRSYVDAAQLASHDLKENIDECHCRRVASEMGMQLNSAHSKLGGGAGKPLARIERLELLVEHLYQKLGETMPSQNGQPH